MDLFVAFLLLSLMLFLYLVNAPTVTMALVAMAAVVHVVKLATGASK